MANLFDLVISQFQSNHQYQKFMKESQKEYDIRIYKLQAMTIPHARAIFAELAAKYGEKSIEPMGNGWHENERRLFVWFVICFVQFKVIDAAKFVDGFEKYWRKISELFWQKDVHLLKYQFLNLIKTKGRAAWKKEEEELLKVAFRKHHKGEWNEIAKEFYRMSDGRYFKTPKQCRERWHNHLNGNLIKGQWSEQEDIIILKFVAIHGSKWAKIIPLLEHTRTEHMIKNRFKSLIGKSTPQKNIDPSQIAKLILKDLLISKGMSEQQMLNDDVGDLLNESKGNYQLIIEQVQSQQIIDKTIKEEEDNISSRKPEGNLFKQRNASVKSNSSKSKHLQPSKQIDARKEQLIGGYLFEQTSKHHVNDSISKSNNSLFSNSIRMIFLGGSHHFLPATPLNMGYLDEFNNYSVSERPKAIEHLFFENESIKRQAKNNESLIGKYIGEI